MVDVGVVRAAGAVVRRKVNGTVEVLLVHRPKYDDWTFPKGKLDPGETYEAAAVREVEEEAGIAGVPLGIELPSTRYVDGDGNDKVVRWWTMVVDADHAHADPDHEVDEVRWLPVDAARRTLTYDRDRPLLDALVAGLADHAESA